MSWVFDHLQLVQHERTHFQRSRLLRNEPRVLRVQSLHRLAYSNLFYPQALLGLLALRRVFLFQQLVDSAVK